LRLNLTVDLRGRPSHIDRLRETSSTPQCPRAVYRNVYITRTVGITCVCGSEHDDALQEGRRGALKQQRLRKTNT